MLFPYIIICLLEKYLSKQRLVFVNYELLTADEEGEQGWDRHTKHSGVSLSVLCNWDCRNSWDKSMYELRTAMCSLLKIEVWLLSDSSLPVQISHSLGFWSNQCFLCYFEFLLIVYLFASLCQSSFSHIKNIPLI